MATSDKIIKILLILYFALLSVGFFLWTCYWIWINAVGIGLAGAGSHISDFEILWDHAPNFLTVAYLALASIGLIKLPRAGFYFAYATTLTFIASILLYLFKPCSIDSFHCTDYSSYRDILGTFLETFLILAIPVISLIGLTKLKMAHSEFKLIDSIIVLVLLGILLSFWNF
jgi:hypothetical protein